MSIKGRPLTLEMRPAMTSLEMPPAITFALLTLAPCALGELI